MRRRLALALAVILTAGAVAAVAMARSGGPGRIAWSGKTTLIRPPSLPADRIVTGTVRNEGGGELEVEATDVKVVDGRGRRLQSSAIFLSGFAHGLWAPGSPQPTKGSDFERARTGKLLQLEPGKTAPLTVSWRRTPGTGPATRIALGDGRTLPLR